MNNGFIYLHRKIISSWIWKNPEYFQWFVHILFRANFQNNKVLIGSELYDIKRGQFITSIQKLTLELNNCTTQKIRTFLRLLEKDKIINIQTTSKLTIITVCKYDSYQALQQTSNKPTTNQQQTNNKPITTENKENKENKEEIKKKNIPTYEIFKTHAKEKCKVVNLVYNESKLRLKYDAWIENEWKDGNDRIIKNWKSKLTNTIGFIFTNNGNKQNRQKSFFT